MPGKFQGPKSLAGYSPWGPKESDTTERLHFHFLQEPQVILAVGNKLIDSVVDITLLCKLNAQITFGFPDGSDGKASACTVGDLGSIPGLGRSPGEAKGYPLQYSGPENSMDYIVHGVEKSWTRMSNFHFHFQRKE